MQLKRVVVTGLGAITPLGNNVQDFWNNLVSGKSGAATITRFDASKFKTQFACEVKVLIRRIILIKKKLASLIHFLNMELLPQTKRCVMQA